MKNLAYRLKFLFSNPFDLFIKTITKFLSIHGAYLTFCEIIKKVFETEYFFDIYYSNFVAIIIISLILMLILSINWKFSYKFKIDGRDSFIKFKVGDISKARESIIISTNTNFITTSCNKEISKDAVQYQVQKRYFPNLKELDLQIKNSLSLNTVVEQNEVFGNTYNRFSVGTVAKVNKFEKEFYFLAINDLNENAQNSSRNYNDVIESIGCLWNYIREKGQSDEIAIPLIGSGHAGIGDATKQKVFELIVSSYIGCCQNCKILKELVIYIHPKDLECFNVNRAIEYLKSKTSFIDTFKGTSLD